MQNVAESKRRPKFSVFDFLNSSKNLADLVESGGKDRSENGDSLVSEIKCEVISGKIEKSENASKPDSNISRTDHEERSQKSTSAFFPEEVKHLYIYYFIK